MVALFVVGTIATLLIVELIVGRVEGRRLVVNEGAGPAVDKVSLDMHFHRGHTWARVEDDNTVTVGIDEFAQKMLGRPMGLDAPEEGARVNQGDPGWHFRMDEMEVPMLAPVSGRVTRINDKLAENPDLVSSDPYGEGWVMNVKPDDLDTSRRNLLDRAMGKHFIRGSYEELSRFLSPELGEVLNDGGEFVNGMLSEIEPERRREAVRRFLGVE